MSRTAKRMNNTYKRDKVFLENRLEQLNTIGVDDEPLHPDDSTFYVSLYLDVKALKEMIAICFEEEDNLSSITRSVVAAGLKEYVRNSPVGVVPNAMSKLKSK